MLKTKSFLRISALAFVVVAGCGGNSNSNMDGSSDGSANSDGSMGQPLTSYSAFATAYIAAQCAHQISCGFIASSGEATCIARLTAGQFPTYDPGAAITAARLKYDETKAESCVAAIKAQDCVRLRALPPDCNVVITGQQQPNGDCNSDLECTGTSLCSGGASGCAGKCSPEADENQSCATNPCKTGLWCKTDSMGMNGMCTKKGAKGAACAGGNFECEDGLVCKANADYMAGTCDTAPSDGPCFVVSSNGFAADVGRDTCAEGSVCDQTQANPVCKPAKKTSEPCGTDDACEGSLFCVGVQYPFFGSGDFVPGTCKAPAKVNDACVDFTACQDQLYCRATDADMGSAGTCVDQIAMNAACDPTDDWCVTGYCERTSKTCKPTLAVNATCDTNDGASFYQCPGSSSCDSATSKCVLCMN